MFTGLVGGTTTVEDGRVGTHAGQLSLRATPYLTDSLQMGASVAVNGVCLTVVDLDRERVGFDVVAPTIEGTTVPDLRPGDTVNLERSLSWGSEVGGHEVSGHVDCVAEVELVEEVGDGVAHVLLGLEKTYRPYVFRKGFVAIDGVSLTVSEVTDTGFGVWLIPETRRATRFADIAAGDRVNIEFGKNVQVVVDTSAQPSRSSPTATSLSCRAMSAS